MRGRFLSLLLSSCFFIFQFILYPAVFAGDKTLFRPPEKPSDGPPAPSAGELKPQRSEMSWGSALRNPNAVKPHGVGIGLGQTFLLGNFEDLGENAINMDLFYSYTASYSFDFLMNYHQSKHPYKQSRVVLQGLAPAIKAKMYQIDSFSPFLLAGLGFYRPRVTRLVGDAGYVESKGKTTFGIHLGFGGDLRLNDLVTVGILGQLHNPFSIKQDLGPSVDGRYFKLLITAMVHF